MVLFHGIFISLKFITYNYTTMKKFQFVFIIPLLFLLPSLQHKSALLAQTGSTVQGIVFHDKNNNGSYDSGEDIPLEGIAVSNSRDVVTSGSDGAYKLPLLDNSPVFLIKPRNWKIPVNENQMHSFYYMHSKEGASGENYEGLSPTSPLPESVDFPLYPQKESDQIKVLVFGDTQPRDDKEIYFMKQDVLPELVNTDADFGVTLGDVVFDNLNLFEHLSGSISTLGVPWWYVPGNHDLDYSGKNNTHARGAWYRTFGPSWYSFSHGPAHFVVLDNIRRIETEGRPSYRTGLGENQMEFLRNEIKRLAPGQLLVLLTHIPIEGSTAWENEAEKKAFFNLLSMHPNSLTLAAHTHRHYHHFIDNSHGFPGEKPHHMISMGTVCGAWWTGAPDEYGIPHTMMSDGTPNGYAFLHINGNNWKLKWKTAGKPDHYQMHIDAPDFLNAAGNEKIKVTANIYNALPSAEVKMRIGKGEWIPMEKNKQKDPYRLAAMESEQQLGDVPWRKLGGASDSEHIWIAEPELSLSPGEYVIEIKAEDKWWNYEGKKILRVK